jgi:hypothetical protein
MKIFVQNPDRFRDKFSAERELLRRFAIAGANLGIEIGGGFSSEEAKDFKPDLILATHPYVAKDTEVLTLGCLWNPCLFMEAVPEFKPNTLTYDGYLFASESIKKWCHELTSGTNKNYLESTLYPSSYRTSFVSPKRFEFPVYVGTNWDGDRHGEIFAELGRRKYIRAYGPASRWQKLNELGAYYGEVEFATDKLLDVYANAAIGLCLHHPSHLKDGIPNMRIFEIIASCALPICDEHAFVKRAFGDCVLYVDIKAAPQVVAEQIIEHVVWIQSHPRQAAEMIHAAHQIYIEKYCLEALLTECFRELKVDSHIRTSLL